MKRKSVGFRTRLRRWLEPSWTNKRRLFPAVDRPGQYFLQCLGGLCLVLFLFQAASGLILLLHYQPWDRQALASIYALESRGAWGWMIRRLHATGAGLLLLLAAGHMLRVVWTGAYKPPRQLNWVTGLALLGLVLASVLSGQVLAWDETGRRLAQALTSLPEVFPWAGTALAQWRRGGETAGQVALGRFYILHLLSPLAAIWGLRAHFKMVRRTGAAGPL